tara:strand:- start:1409 stop:1645 length:237 start_codon:yes stop_codon:yes gene_type:complete
MIIIIDYGMGNLCSVFNKLKKIGAKDYKDFSRAESQGYASAVAAGSLFVYHGPRKAVLISFPSKNELSELFNIRKLTI